MTAHAPLSASGASSVSVHSSVSSSSSMRTLFLNIASQDGLLAVAVDDLIGSIVQLHPRMTDANLVQALASLTADEWPVESLERIACVTGPGGFTSLRVACAFANALSHFQKIPLAGIHLSDLYAARACHPESAEGWWLHSTKRELVFLRGFGRHADACPEPTLVKLEEMDRYIQRGERWMGELIPEHRTLLESRGVTEAELLPLETVLPALLDSVTYEHQSIEPWYGRGW